jgi:hypothetical protein
MKYLITESKLEDLLKHKFKLDIRKNLHKVENFFDLPADFMSVFGSKWFFDLQRQTWGPIYLLEIGENSYLLQKNKFGVGWEVKKMNDIRSFDEKYLMKELGLNVLGISFDRLMSIYLNDED